MDKEHIINLSFTVYKVTELFSKEEPLKTEIRTRVNEILNDLLFIQNSDELGINVDEVDREIIKNIENLKKYFELAIVKELASPTNFLVLQREYDKISKEVKKEKSFEIEPQNIDEEEKIGKWVLERQKQILDIISKKQKIQVQGIQDSLQGISKRTIQRDLVFLTNKGLVRAQGDFNRTFYELA
ncbi:DeoR family transcriptional regulator [Candidatus Parcubacteria bacterium]|nr:DeoR family transcriptional regulator [Candidatus Parcubacteria bacterium]